MKTPLFSLLFLLLASFAYAEPYSNRPDVNAAITAKKASANAIGNTGLSPENWEKFKAGTLRFLAELRALYPNDDYYFLARDGEYLYDAMKVLAQDDPALLKRIRLVNVSTALSNNSGMRPYLIQEGLTKEKLKGKGVVLIDTCCGASIPEKIKAAFPELKGQLKGHFLTSTGQFTPSSRVFLEAYTPGEIKAVTTQLGIQIEGFPHFTSSANVYQNEKGKLEPYSNYPASTSEKDKARTLMADLKAHFTDPKVKETYTELTEKMSTIAAAGRGERKLSDSALKKLLREVSLLGAVNFAADMEDAHKKGTVSFPKLASVREGADVAVVKPLATLKPEQKEQLLKLVKKNPQLQGILENPVDTLAKLKPADAELMTAIADVQNTELSKYVHAHINDDSGWKKNTEARARVYEKFVEVDGLDLDTLFEEIRADEKLAKHFGSHPNGYERLRELLKNDVWSVEDLFKNFLMEEPMAGSDNAFKLLDHVVRRYPDDISKISEDLFKQPEAWFQVGKSEALVSHLIKNADEADLDDLMLHVFSKPEWMEKHGDTIFPKLLKELAKQVQDGTWKLDTGHLAEAAASELWQKNAAFQSLCKGRPFGTTCFEKYTPPANLANKAGAKPGLAKDFLKSDVRPVVADVLKSDAAVKKALEGVPLPAKLQDEKGLYKIYEEVLAEVLQKNPDHKLVFLARDSELLFDGLQALIENHPQKALIKDRVVLMNLSRPIAQTSNLSQLRIYFDAHGISLDEMVNGQGKYLFFDTGNRGSIFLQIMDKAITEIPKGPGRAEKIKTLLKNMNVLLMGSERPKSTLAKVLPQITDHLSDYQISNLLRTQLYFEEALDGKAFKLGMPSDPLTKRRWIADRVEYLPHWTGRAQRLTATGSSIAEFETPPTDLERKQALLLQVRAMEHFQQPEVAKRFDQLLTKFAEAGAGKDALILAKESEKASKKLASSAAPVLATETEKPKAAAAELQAPEAEAKVKVVQPEEAVKKFQFDALPATKASNLTAMQNLKAGAVMQTDSGVRYRIVKEADVGKRGKVYQAVDEYGKHVAIKVPKNSDADTLASIAEEKDKVAKLKEHGLPHAAIREASDTVVVKDWVEGVRADAFMKQWEQTGKNPNAPEIKKLAELLDGAASKNVYVGDLNPKNLIWVGGEWIIVDSGGIDEGKAKAEALKRYLEKIPRRWSKYVSNPTSCSTMFTQALQQQLSP